MPPNVNKAAKFASSGPTCTNNDLLPSRYGVLAAAVKEFYPSSKEGAGVGLKDNLSDRRVYNDGEILPVSIGGVVRLRVRLSIYTNATRLILRTEAE